MEVNLSKKVLIRSLFESLSEEDRRDVLKNMNIERPLSDEDLYAKILEESQSGQEVSSPPSEFTEQEWDVLTFFNYEHCEECSERLNFVYFDGPITKRRLVADAVKIIRTLKKEALLDKESAYFTIQIGRLKGMLLRTSEKEKIYTLNFIIEDSEF